MIRCSKGIEHGELDLVSAFARSCNGAYAVIGQSLDRAALFRLCETFGYNKDLDIGLMSNRSSYKLTEEGSLWEVLQTSIGQGVTQITPLHNCMIAAAIANDGRMMRPTVLDHTETASGTVVKTYGESTFAANVMTTEEAELMTQFMRRVVTSGTGSAADLDEWPVAGKTGSAEWASGKDPHAWFVGFAPADEPEIAVSVLIESGGSGGGTAAPIAHDLFRTYFYEVRDESGD